ncbi:hypothetical protein B566_EDAN003891 [Ephemera danica]|nr:hypothetical protein B566_EDAN003891 [Ephemera danica]
MFALFHLLSPCSACACAFPGIHQFTTAATAHHSHCRSGTMEVAPEVAQLCEQLIRAVQVSMNPTGTKEERKEAYQALEQFKETSPMCAECGLYLALLPNDGIIRHFGLQLMEHCVKYRWNKMTQQEKLFIKTSLGLVHDYRS